MLPLCFVGFDLRKEMLLRLDSSTCDWTGNSADAFARSRQIVAVLLLGRPLLQAHHYCVAGPVPFDCMRLCRDSATCAKPCGGSALRRRSAGAVQIAMPDRDLACLDPCFCFSLI
jgi:hypothetical protein